jgi:tRNA-uridine 2-sulfurtransferase
MLKDNLQKNVFVGLSGGVDSSVAAALLRQDGYNVTGIYMQNWTQDVAGVHCPWKEDLASAKSVAVALDIPLKVYNFQSEYKQKVVDYMVAEYKAGRTPNPDIMCNQEIKFKLFLEAALVDGADLIATGHYARVVNRCELHSGIDLAKDQSYFLHRVSQKALEKTIMPIGAYTKTEIRKMAAEFGLSTANKPDSQGLCFVGEVGLRDFLRQFVQTKGGNIIDQTGKVIGTHEGAIFFTIGQRHGLGIGGGKPLYVVSKDMAANTVTVTDDPADLILHSSEFNITNAHWISGPPSPGNYHVRTRYRAPLIACELSETDNGFCIQMDRPDRAITPGQSAVIYEGTQVLGGGIIS